MQTQLAEFIRNTPEGREADEILRKCVHCGFCTATCPTYQLLGDELDGPRGRIYLIKQVLEGQPVSEKTRLHLDRCLTCRSCESTCPSGVHYGRLVDIGRQVVEERVPRHGLDRFARWALRETLPRAGVFGAAIKAGRTVRNMLPARLRDKLPEPGEAGLWPAPRHSRRMLALAGCVQPALAPVINAASARVLDALGISLVEEAKAGCCGAVRYHLNDQRGGLEDARRNIDAWWPAIERGDIEQLVMTASGCGVQVREYGHLLRNDPLYAERAHKVSSLTRDISEIVATEAGALDTLLAQRSRALGTVAFHAPCTLQHGLKVRGVVEGLLTRAGYSLTPVADGHLCCGSAGTYSLLQPEISLQLRENKLAALEAGEPAVIATANIGCLSHLQGGTERRVRHWIELLDAALHAP